MEFPIENSNRFGAISLARLQLFETELGSELPGSYRKFLILHNGGHPKGARSIQALHHIYGLHDGPSWAQFPDRKRIYRGGLPQRMLPIADDPGGNLYCISLEPPDRGFVYFWDHECTGEQAFHLLARDFTYFLDGLAWMVVMRQSDLTAVQNALKADIEIDRPVYGKSTLFDLAAESGNLEIQKLLVLSGATIHGAAIIEAVRHADLNAVKFLVNQGLSVNFTVPDTGFTPLMLAASGGASDVAEYLVAQGADRRAMNKWGKKASDLAHTPEMKAIVG